MSTEEKFEKLQYISNLVVMLKEMGYYTMTIKELSNLHDELVSEGLLSKEDDMNLVKAIMKVTDKYDHGFGVEPKLWVDLGDKFAFDYLIMKENGETEEKITEHDEVIKVKDALIIADDYKKEYDAYKVLLLDKNTKSMLASLTTKGPSKEEVEKELDRKDLTSDNWKINQPSRKKIAANYKMHVPSDQFEKYLKVLDQIFVHYELDSESNVIFIPTNEKNHDELKTVIELNLTKHGVSNYEISEDN